MQFLNEEPILENQYIVLPHERYIEDVEEMFGCNLDILKQTPSYQQFLDLVTFENVKDSNYNSSLSGFRLYINFEKKLVGSASEKLKFKILSVSNRIIMIDGIVITSELTTQLQNECKSDVKTINLWTSLDQLLFERIASETDPKTVQRLCSTNQKLRSRCNEDFYKRMLMKFYGETVKNAKERFIWHLYPKAYVFGENEAFQLGLGNNQQSQFTPKLLILPARPEKLTGFSKHSLILDTRGRVWSCGNNFDGELGREGVRYKPQKVDVDAKIIDVACGYEHSLILDSEGRVWAFGQNRFGQLGIGNKFRENVPSMIRFGYKVTAIACAGYHSMILDEKGRVWSFGYNIDNNLGLHRLTEKEIVPQLIKMDKRIIAISTMSHTMLLDEDGKVWCFGLNAHGQLGLGHTIDQELPQMIPFEHRVIAISCGGEHSMLLDEEGRVWSFGLNSHGQLGLGHTNNHNTPQLLEFDRRIIAISSGGIHSLMIDEEGHAWGFGYNLWGQVGQKQGIEFPRPVLIESQGEVIQIHAAHSYSMFIAK